MTKHILEEKTKHILKEKARSIITQRIKANRIVLQLRRRYSITYINAIVPRSKTGQIAIIQIHPLRYLGQTRKTIHVYGPWSLQDTDTFIYSSVVKLYSVEQINLVLPKGETSFSQEICNC